jgi:radical SAM protein (TIGR01212 family)
MTLQGNLQDYLESSLDAATAAPVASELEPRFWGPKKRRWNYFKDVLRSRFGEIVYKVGVDAGFDCPNRDGTKAFGGCAYCSQAGSHSPHLAEQTGIAAQIERGKWFIKKRYGAEKYIVYFQAFTNTYAPVDVLRERYDSALGDLAKGELTQENRNSGDSDCVGLSIASRPDCINEENADLLAEYAERLPLFTVELGLQSAFQNRLSWVNRQETLDDYYKSMELLRARKIPVISHVILGFPGETPEEMRTTALLADQLGSTGIKLQMLHVIKGTKMGVMHSRNPFSLMPMDEYGELVVSIVERLSPTIEIHRITGETEGSMLVAPEWVRHKTKFFDWFDAELERRNTWQGKFYSSRKA